jgi:L-lactate dehydrogenase complex protein LldF
MSGTSAPIDFRRNSKAAPEAVATAVQHATTRLLENRAKVVGAFGDARWQAYREAGHNLRHYTIAHLDACLTEFEGRLTAAGGHVHWAQDADAANRTVLEIARTRKVRRAVKVKSMATEEIGLNEFLIGAGIETLETDLGEYIIQLAGVPPSHIITPAVHLSKEGIAGLFHEKLGVDTPPVPEQLTAVARGRLREAFLAVEMGISGANFLVAETGQLVIVSNEGNGRMCTTLPPLHVAVVGIDKVVPDLRSLAILLRLLARSATGQKITCYTSFIGGPSLSAEEGGPRELHVVLLDNGRTRVLSDRVARDALLCIRCGACLNVCPVYRHVGGHAYGNAYSGPIGAILAPQLLGVGVAGALPFASSLCGACAEICPVQVPIPEILIHLRRRVVQGDAIDGPVVSPALRSGAGVAAAGLRSSRLYRLGSVGMGILQAPFRRDGWLDHLPPPASRWTGVRPMPAFSPGFRRWWRRRK